MKRILILILTACFLIPCAVADIDLSSMTFDELRALQSQITEEIHSRPEWKEVTVPAGDWIVGEDIPEGTYSIKSVDQSRRVNVTAWGYAVDDYRTNGGLRINTHVDKNSPTLGKVKLEKGWIISFTSPVIMAPSISLGF